MLNLFSRPTPRSVEEQRIVQSNAKRDVERQRSYCAELGLIVHQSRERIAELRKEASELEAQLPARQRRLSEANERLKRMEETVKHLSA